tara:strand:- start:6509 stop:7624 length:1116 start_codon:yes stop_codon:yes gene_type:complete
MNQTTTLTILPGDGIGPEVMDAALAILDVAASKFNLKFKFQKELIGGASLDTYGEPITEPVLEKCKESKAIILGAVGGPNWDDIHQDKKPEKGLLILRQSLDLFSNLRPAIVFDSIADASSLKKDVIIGSNILVVRELTGGIYFGEPRGYNEHEGYNTLRYTKKEVERIAHVAFKLAEKRNGHVTSVDKANVLDSSQFWRKIVNDIHKQYKHLELENMYVDNAAMQIVRNPKQFDVILTQNMFGDILSDITAMITGSLGMLPSSSIGPNNALYEPVHGTAPEIAGKNQANPIAMISSVAMMLDMTMNLPHISKQINTAIETVLNEGIRTHDIKNNGSAYVSTTEMRDYIIESFKENIIYNESQNKKETVEI